jgi:hypothetical protein
MKREARIGFTGLSRDDRGRTMVDTRDERGTCIERKDGR